MSMIGATMAKRLTRTIMTNFEEKKEVRFMRMMMMMMMPAS